MKVVITIDVEEEGLFSGRYPRIAPGVANVPRLGMLEWLTRDYGLPLTLLADYPVVRDAKGAESLLHLHEGCGAEIGAHLHPWNTPPFEDGHDPLDSSSMSFEALCAKLAVLKRAVAEGTGVTPVSFRMGRWDYSPAVGRALISEGFKVDASIVPLKPTPAGDAWFGAPPDPFWADGPGGMLEVPLTMIVVFPKLARFIESRRELSGQGALRPVIRHFHKVAVVGIQPVWHSLWSMKAAAELHRRRGGEVLSLFFHSSELLPGASPHFPTEASVKGLLDKLRAFFDWLGARVPLEGDTLTGLRAMMEDRL